MGSQDSNCCGPKIVLLLKFPHPNGAAINSAKPGGLYNSENLPIHIHGNVMHFAYSTM